MHLDSYWIWLSKIKISVVSKRTLLEKFKSPKKIWELNDEVKKIVTEDEFEEMQKLEYKNNLEKELEFLKKYNVKIINCFHNFYPNNLKNIYDMPIVLYAIGNINKLKEKSIAIVGTRKCSKYGKFVSKLISKEISKNNINIISGLANGIDTEAHIGADGNTIVVLGSGINVIYPYENLNLAKDIIYKGGLIITEYPIGTKPERMNFPNRNRIISGISEGVIVVEAKKRSGSLITADFAMEQGKDVYAVPGNITSKNSEGTNNLIKDGAISITNIEDLQYLIENL